MNSRAEMGVGTLIVFIAMLLVAAVAAGVLIQTTGSLQEKALSTGAQARGQVATTLNVMEVSGSDGTNGTFNYLQQIVKLAPGSNPIKISQMILTLNSYDSTATLTYRGPDGDLENNNSGYNTWSPQEIGELRLYAETNNVFMDWNVYTLDVDLDGDYLPDSVRVCRQFFNACTAGEDGRYLIFQLTTAGDIYEPLLDSNQNPVDIAAAPKTMGNTRSPIGTDGVYGTFTTTGTTSNAYRLNAGQFSTYVPQTILNDDIDDDGSNDEIAINDSHVLFFLSSGPIVNVSTGYNINTAPVVMDVTADISHDGVDYGTVKVEGTTAYDSVLQANMTVLVTPENVNRGYFVGEYLQTGNNHVPGNLQRGDVIRFYYEAPREIGESEDIRINIVPKIGSSALTTFVTPDVISSERVYLYP